MTTPPDLNDQLDVKLLLQTLMALKKGDFSARMPSDLTGVAGKIADTLNEIIETKEKMVHVVTEVSRVVGREGRLSQRAQTPNMTGGWATIISAVNTLIDDLVRPTSEMARVIGAVAKGDLSQTMALEVDGMPLRGQYLSAATTANTMVEQLLSFSSEVTRVAREVGTEGKLGGQAQVKGVAGTWKDLTDSVNSMAGNLTSQVRNIAEVTTAVANGDLSKKITVDVRGEILQLKDTINVMVDQLRSFASEVTRVAREVGTEGKLGGQAYVPGVGGTWKDLTDNVNFMASNLTDQVRNIAAVTTAVANGDLSKKITVDVKGEILELKDTFNVMVDQLSSFASEVTRVAREVGTEGKLGGQANVSGVAGTWKDLTENVNQLAANLTNQVRAIAEVATAVTRGDLSRSIQVEARGEVSYLKDNINEMIRNLKDTTLKNAQQDWLKTNLARFTRLLQGQRDLQAVTRLILSELAPLVSAHHGVFYMMDAQYADARLRMIASYGYRSSRKLPTSFLPGEGLVGQCALEKTRIWLTDVPRDYIVVSSGLGAAPPNNIVVLPILFEQQVKAVIEIASLDRFTDTHLSFLDQLMESIGVVLNTIEANSRTESLLTQSQSLAQELQQTNQELAEKARLLSEQNIEVERKNREVEQAKLALEEKATQLALSSKYKSEFLANMSHELRTPLNSLLILAQQLGDNPDGNLSGKQVEFARTIHGSGSDLLTLINDILDLSKIESGTVTLDVAEYRFQTLRNYVERTFRHMAEAKHLGFSVDLRDNLPAAVMTDTTRLQQVLKNLLSNAFKFTTHGQVALVIGLVEGGFSSDHPTLGHADAVLAFAVSDTGVGIAGDKLQLIFEAFQQADGSTARKYGGTGLGLSISRELARLLGGEIRVESVVGSGSTFTLFLPYNRAGFVDHADHHALRAPRLAALPAPEAILPALQDDEEVDYHDDRAQVTPGEPSVLIIEDDERFAAIVLDFARENGFKGIVTARGDSALSLARDYLPSAILLDLDLPDIDGFTVLERLKRDPGTRHIPVHVLSSLRERERALRLGAISYLNKPVDRDELQQEFARIQKFLLGGQRSLLVVDDDATQRDAIVALIGAADLRIVAVGTGLAALEALREQRFDCMVLDLTLPDISGFDLLDTMASDPALHDLPVVINTASDPDPKSLARLKGNAKSIVIKDARSPERLLDETALFLHRATASLPEAQRRMIEEIHEADGGLAGRKVLIVDDDLRNIFALSSLLERQQMQVSFAENGRDGIEVLERDPTIEIVLMDIMMPEMDGYDTMRAIRRLPKFRSLPIITLTAKAMKGDRDKCIAAGASDYITKPVDVAQLLSLMRVWLH
jgi:CheY-like chemotaxis protein/HAMP domain-containing protein/GAF domain-containing protein